MALQFAPFVSDIELPFYSALANLKINHDKLDDSARKVLGLYEIRPNDLPESSCRMQILANALTSDQSVRASPFLQSQADVDGGVAVFSKAIVAQKASSRTSTRSRNIDRSTRMHTWLKPDARQV